jgi:hypothetical protein
LQDHPQIISYS